MDISSSESRGSISRTSGAWRLRISLGRASWSLSIARIILLSFLILLFVFAKYFELESEDSLPGSLASGTGEIVLILLGMSVAPNGTLDETRRVGTSVVSSLVVLGRALQVRIATISQLKDELTDAGEIASDQLHWTMIKLMDDESRLLEEAKARLAAEVQRLQEITPDALAEYERERADQLKVLAAMENENMRGMAE